MARRGRQAGLQGDGRPTPGAGHNSERAELTNDEERALLIDWSGKLRSIDEQIKDLRSDRKKTVGGAKADGIKAKDLARFMEIQDSDEDAIQADIAKTVRYSTMLGYGMQGDLFPDAKRAPNTNAYNSGFTDGVLGREAKTDYTGAAHSDYMEGWHAGGAAHRSALEKRRDEEGQTIIPMIDKTHAERAAEAAGGDRAVETGDDSGEAPKATTGASKGGAAAKKGATKPKAKPKATAARLPQPHIEDAEEPFLPDDEDEPANA